MSTADRGPELRQSPDALAFDVGRLEAWMAAHVGGFCGPIEVRRFTGGQSNPTYLVQSPSQHYVLRRKPPGQLLPSAHAIEREFRVLRALQHTAVPVARVHVLCEDPTVIGSAFYLMDYVSGRIFWRAALPEIAPESRRAIYIEMVRVQAALHQVDYRALGLKDYGKSSGYVARQVSRWTQQYRASQTEKIEAFENLIEWLPQHVPEDEQAAIVHGDFRLDNAIFAAGEARILAVLDWELSTIGHPLVDFAYFCMRYHLPETPLGGLAGVDLRALAIPSEADCIAEYCRLRNFAAIAPRDWTYYMAVSMFRLGAILQGVRARALQGNASSATALERGALARPVAEVAWRKVSESLGL